MADTKQCPFGPCGRMLETHWGTRIEKGQLIQVLKMPYHQCPPEADIHGDCPASGTGLPLTARDQMYLTQMEEVYVQRNINREGVPRRVIEGEIAQETEVPDNVRPISPPPDLSNGWFRNSDMPDHGNVQGTGAEMSSVSELRGAIDRVHTTVSEAMAAQAVVNERLDEAIVALAATSDTTSSDAAQGAMGALNQAKENGQLLLGQTLVAQEQLSVWGATL